MSDFFNNHKDCIALIISIISLLISFYNFIYAYLNKKTKLRISINTHDFHETTHQFFITIENRSQLPVSISNIKLNKSYYCVLEPTCIRENIKYSGHDVISRNEIKTVSFPISLNPLESRSAYLEFRNVDNFDINHITFSLFTNRKYIKKVKITNFDGLTKK